VRLPIETGARPELCAPARQFRIVFYDHHDQDWGYLDEEDETTAIDSAKAYTSSPHSSCAVYDDQGTCL